MLMPITAPVIPDSPNRPQFVFVPKAGLEPALPFGNDILSVASLPNSSTTAYLTGKALPVPETVLALYLSVIT